MILSSVVKNFCEHGFIGVLTMDIDLLKVSIGFTFLCETIHFEVQVIQEKAFHAILGQKLLHHKPVFLIQTLLIIISHQYIVSYQIRQPQFNTSGVDALEYFLCVVIMIQFYICTNQIINTVMDHHNGIRRIFGKKCCDQFLEQHIVMINNAVLSLIHLIKFTCHQQLQLVIISFNRLEF